MWAHYSSSTESVSVLSVSPCLHDSIIAVTQKSFDIVHFTSGHPPSDIRIFKKECTSLAEDGYQVTLVATFYDQLAERMTDGVRIRVVRRFPNRIARLTRTAWNAFMVAIRQKADLYHFHDPELIPAGLLLRAMKKTVIYDVHEDTPSDILRASWLPSGSRRALSWLFDQLERFAARQFSALVTANGEITKRLFRFNDHVIMVGNYPRLEDFPIDLTANKARFHSGVVVSFGGISPRTCTRAIVTAMGLVPKTCQAKLILGGINFSDALLREVTQLEGWQRVQNIGRVSHEHVANQLSNAAAALVLYPCEPGFFGIGSNRFFEAMAAGIPVITSNFPNWRETVRRIGCGITVNPEDPPAIAEAITYVLTHPAESAEMGERGRQAIVNEFNWAVERSKLLNLYRELLGSRGNTTH